MMVVKTVSIMIVVGTLIASVTPTQKDDVFMSKIRKVWMGLLAKVSGGIGYNIEEDPCVANHGKEMEEKK